MIRFDEVTKVYNGTHKAVDGLSLEIQPGEIFGFLGPNGAGKTTTLKMLVGITPPTSGQIEVNGIDILKDPIQAKSQFGYVPDNPDIYIRLRGIEYLNFMGDIYNVPPQDRQQRIEQMARDFEMTSALGDKIQSYSHGMRQKIVLMGALIHEPNAWILDEPMTGLDPKSSYILKERMRSHADRGNIVFFSTHVLEVAEKICDRVAIINKGKLLYVGNVQNLRETLGENTSLEQMFLELTENE
ncbi:ABC transporter ATP-binding protein [Proteiniclasticum sp. QWL-01]|uniref:ABC transporter ATP-binding protein n=1 Tax=Proteiniclasticum sp. QWL-01 TaxID=3036945 RepID=UPI00220C7CCD|nr:ABC transporter ATP-binding protein [Proteiniclasticum sp. QWL-01]UUM12327.1 ABC transporter ATP-binding protein [Clostridiaceae bacterium HFYG-1003]WFF73857.1 ABC transporter ATP-binding protein [Proteiniclasticum sp. QWL-01]